MVGLVGHHQIINQDAGNLHLLRRQGAARHDLRHLDDHHTAGIAHRLGLGQAVGKGHLAVHGDVAAAVGQTAAQDRAIDAQARVMQIGFAVDVDLADQAPRGAVVQATAGLIGIDEGVQPDLGDDAGLSAGNRAEQVADDPLRPIVGLDLVPHGQLAESRDQPPETADHPADQPRRGQPVQPPPPPVTLPGGKQQRQVAGVAIGAVTVGQRRRHRLGVAAGSEAAGGDGPSALDDAGGFGGGHDLHGDGPSVWEGAGKATVTTRGRSAVPDAAVRGLPGRVPPAAPKPPGRRSRCPTAGRARCRERRPPACRDHDDRSR